MRNVMEKFNKLSEKEKNDIKKKVNEIMRNYFIVKPTQNNIIVFSNQSRTAEPLYNVQANNLDNEKIKILSYIIGEKDDNAYPNITAMYEEIVKYLDGIQELNLEDYRNKIKKLFKEYNLILK